MTTTAGAGNGTPTATGLLTVTENMFFASASAALLLRRRMTIYTTAVRIKRPPPPATAAAMITVLLPPLLPDAGLTVAGAGVAGAGVVSLCVPLMLLEVRLVIPAACSAVVEERRALREEVALEAVVAEGKTMLIVTETPVLLGGGYEAAEMHAEQVWPLSVQVLTPLMVENEREPKPLQEGLLEPQQAVAQAD